MCGVTLIDLFVSFNKTQQDNPTIIISLKYFTGVQYSIDLIFPGPRENQASEETFC